ncbi:MAG: AzlC family ABC transporter permease [Desulfobacterales bacterium]
MVNLKFYTKRTEFFIGARDTLPLVIGAIPFGIIFGTLSGGAGLSTAGTVGMSLFVFAGSAQFIAMGLVGAGTAWPLIVLTTFVVNFRHFLYTAALLPYLKRLPPGWQAVLAFGLTDETFAVAVGRYGCPDAGPYKHWYQLGSMVFMYINWNLCTVVGLAAGRMLSRIGHWGLDFAMVAAFIGMIIPYLKNRPTYFAVLVSGAAAVLLNGLPHKLGLILATVAGIAAGVTADTLASRKPDAVKAEEI